MDWQSAEPAENKGIVIPDRWLHLYYYEALNILFRFENALRIFVYVILKRELGKDWDQASIGDGITIKTETKKRISQAKEHGYLGYEVTSPVLYLNSGELTEILTSEAYWKYFAKYFKATKSVVLTKLQEIGTVRNSLAHFRPVKQDDVDLIKQNSKHVLLQIENCLSHISSINDVVPTNTETGWYKEIKPIGNKQLMTSLFHSLDQQWVRIELSYEVPTLQKNMYAETFCAFKVANLRTTEILKRYSSIREHCIYVSEAPVYGSFRKDQSISIAKSISIVLARTTIDTAHQPIAEELKEIARLVEAETALLMEDNLARGHLIEPQSGTAHYRTGNNNDKYWAFDVEKLKTPLEDVEAVEFWGQRTHYVDDFIAATSRYPWMPSSVSNPTWFE